MPLDLVTEAPKREDFTPLLEHQSQTPTTFFGARPVLHYHASGAKLVVRRTEYDQHDVWRQIHAASDSEIEEVVLVVDIWISSKTVCLFSPLTSRGIAVDYPTIALHALGLQDGQTTVYLQLDLHDLELTNDDDDIQTLTMHLIPEATVEEATNGHAEETSEANGGTAHNSAAAKSLFEALSACADLNPDPMDEDEDGVEPELPTPGAGGWITSDNMHEFMDEHGNWTGPELAVLGAGAGQIRPREDGDEDGTGDSEESKWQRTG